MHKPILLCLVLCSTQVDAQWVSVPPGGLIEFESVLVDDAEHFLVAGENGAAFRTSDGGASWTPATGLGVESIRDFLRLDEQTILAASDGVVFRSTNNGITWTSVSTPATDDLHALARFSNMVVAVGRSGWIVRSMDAGLTWNAQTSGTAERIFCVAMRSATEYFAGGKNGTFLQTTNGGSSWNPASLPASDDWVGIHFFSDAPMTGLLCGEDGTMLRTTNGGASWTEVSTGSTMALSALASAHDSVIYAAGSTGTALKSTDLGQSWSEMTSPAFSVLNGIDVRNGMAVAAGANGTVIKLGSGGSGVGMEERMYDTGLAVHPNPARDGLQVEWNGELNGRQQLEVLAMDGRVVDLGSMVLHSQYYDLGGLSAGCYILRLRSPQGVTAQERFLVVE